MDSLMTAAARALAAGDPFGALKRVALAQGSACARLNRVAAFTKLSASTSWKRRALDGPTNSLRQPTTLLLRVSEEPKALSGRPDGEDVSRRTAPDQAVHFGESARAPLGRMRRSSEVISITASHDCLQIFQPRAFVAGVRRGRSSTKSTR